MCQVVWVRGREWGGGLAGYQPGVYVSLKALFLVYSVSSTALTCSYPKRKYCYLSEFKQRHGTSITKASHAIYGEFFQQ